MLAAPLIAGNDISKMSKETNEILTNKEVINIDQDPLGIQGFMYASKDSLETWFKPLNNGNWAVCFLNRSITPKPVEFNWKNEMINDTLSKTQLNASLTNYTIRNLWTKKDQAKYPKNH